MGWQKYAKAGDKIVCVAATEWHVSKKQGEPIQIRLPKSKLVIGKVYTIDTVVLAPPEINAKFSEEMVCFRLVDLPSNNAFTYYCFRPINRNELFQHMLDIVPTDNKETENV